MDPQSYETLHNLKAMVEAAQSRGCWKAVELMDVGITYNRLCDMIKQYEDKQPTEGDSVPLSEGDSVPLSEGDSVPLSEGDSVPLSEDPQSE
jgi:hypothetical protein